MYIVIYLISQKLTPNLSWRVEKAHNEQPPISMDGRGFKIQYFFVYFLDHFFLINSEFVAHYFGVRKNICLSGGKSIYNNVYDGICL